MFHACVKRTCRLLLVGALAGFGMVAVVSGPAAADEACTRTFSSRVDFKIPDKGVLGDNINVPEDGLVVADVDVSVNAHHPSPTDLSIVVTSFPDHSSDARGSSTLFLHDGAGAGDDIVGAAFDDDATRSIATARAPYAGRWKPVSPLAGLRGFTGGTYNFMIRDDVANGVGGVLDDWAVTFTYASCDFDRDGVEDHHDQCRDVPARTATGCPLTSRTLTAKNRHGRIRGVLASPVAGCKAHRAVSIFRKRPGPDRRVGTATSRADGSWRLSRPKRHGRYYATSARVVVPDRAECPAVRSRTFRVR